MINSKQHRGCRIQDLGTRGKHQTKKQIPGVPAGAVGCRIQDPGICGYRWWKTADFSYRARTAHAQLTVRPLGLGDCLMLPRVRGESILWPTLFHTGGQFRLHTLEADPTAKLHAAWYVCHDAIQHRIDKNRQVLGREQVTKRSTHARRDNPPPPLQSPPLACDGLPGRGGGVDGRQVMVSHGGGGGIARVFQGKLWYPPLMQAKRTQVKGLLR